MPRVKKATPATSPASPLPVQAVITPQLLDFPNAVKALASGERVTRAEWNDPNTFMFLGEKVLMIRDQHRTIDGVIDGPLGNHIAMVDRKDILAEDWYVVP